MKKKEFINHIFSSIKEIKCFIFRRKKNLPKLIWLDFVDTLKGFGRLITFRRKKTDGWVENIKIVVYAFLLAMIFRSFLFEPFHIPSSSMYPTLVEGDYVFVSKYSYGYSRYSFPGGIPFFKGRILGGEPKRGDVVVFRYPSNPKINYIKRLIGVPGDQIQMRNGILYINNQKVSKEYQDMYTLPKAVKTTFFEMKEVPMYKETLPNGKKYLVLDMLNIDADNTVVFNVPKGYYFFLGDNRDNSQDSRFMVNGGLVPEANLIGKAKIVLISSSEPFWQLWKFYKMFRFKRFFNGIE
jgi:signal peptidase I